MNQDAKLAQSELEALQSRKEAIATQWYNTIAAIVPGLIAAEVKPQFAGWVHEAISLLSQESPQWRAAQIVGENLAQEISPEAPVLGKTQELVAHELTKELSAERAAALFSRVTKLLSELAIGFVQEQTKHVRVVRRRFLSTTSHDMRSPLNAIIGFSRIISKGVDGPVTDVQQQDLTTIHKSGQALLKMIDDTFNIEKIEAGSVDLDVKDFDPADAARGAVEAVQPLVDENANSLQSDLAESLGQMRSDFAKVKQVLETLLGYSARFTKRGTITLNASADGEQVRFQITDSGLGLTSAQITRFGQVANPDTLQYDEIPLMVTQRLCQLLGGEMTIESTGDRGATFVVALPMRHPST